MTVTKFRNTSSISHYYRERLTMAGCRRTAAILAFLLSSLTSPTVSLNLNTAAPSIKINIRFVPSQVKFQQVSQQYPETLARRLFSSVPRREFALHNVSFTLQSELALLTGASSSGKSALMKIISGVETPVQGSVHIQCLWSAPDPTQTQSQPRQVQWVAQPVYLEQRPSVDGRRTVRQILCQQKESILQKLLLASASSRSSSKTSNNPKQQSESSSLRIFLESLLNALTTELCSCLQLTTTSTSTTNDNNNNKYNGATAAWMDQTPLQLSPSQSYRLALVTACLQSSMANLNFSVLLDPDVDVDTLFPTDTDDSTTERQLRTVSLPAPILLLDEWMDTETTEIIQTVQRGLEQLAQIENCGAVIVSATHKAERWKKPYSEMVLSRGQVLSWNRIKS
jgi:ABC-type dipeptide/oligopeptide/nickel transport system ATPase subunit